MKQREYQRGQAGAEFGQGAGAGSLPQFQEGQSNIGRSLLEGGVKAGQALTELAAREYVERRNAEVDDLVLGVSEKFERWKNEYNEKNQGKYGLNAFSDYNSKFEELAREAGEAFDAGENEVFQERLRRKLAERQLFVLRDGGMFQARQRELWLSSQVQTQEADFQAYAAANPNDDEGIAFKRQKMVEKLGELHPGQDLGALLVKLDNRTLASRMRALQLEEDYEGMERLLSARSRLQKAGLSAGSALGTWAAVHNNPGCVKTDKDNMAMFATPAEGVAAIMDRPQAYARKGHDTIAKIMNLYAPKNDNNDTEAYIRFICKATGKDRNEKIDTSDPAFLRSFAKAIAQKENSLKLSDAEIEAGLNFLQTHGKPRAVGRIPVNPNGRRALLANGIGPDEIRNWEKVIEAGRQQYNFKVLQGRAEEMWRSLQGLPENRRAQAFFEATQELPIEERRKLAEIIGPEITASEQYAKRELEARQEQALPRVLEADKAEVGSLVEELAGDLQPAQKMQMRNYLLGARQQHEQALNMEWNISWQRMLDGRLSELADASPAAQNALLRGFVTEMARGSDDADAMLEYGKRFLERQNRAREAQDLLAVEQIEKTGADPEARRALLEQAIAQKRISGQGAKRALELLFGPASEETRENSQALMRGKQLVSSGALATEAARREYAKTHKLTLPQEKELVAFAGYGANSVWNKAQSVAKSLGFENVKPEEIDWICARLPADHEPSDREIREIVKMALSQSPGRFFGLGSGSSLVEEIADNPALEDWLPRIEEHEENFYMNSLRAMGLQINDHNMRVLKKRRLARQFGLDVKDEFIQ